MGRAYGIRRDNDYIIRVVSIQGVEGMSVCTILDI